MDDPFGRLPPEALLIMIRLVPHFSSLLHLVQASAFAAGMYQTYPVDIVRNLSSRLPKELQQAIRAVAASLSRPSNIPQLTREELMMDLKHLFNRSSTNANVGYRFPSDLPPSSAKTLVRLEWRIAQFTMSFLDTHIERVNSPQPMHLVRPGHHFDFDPFKDYPEGRSYTPKKNGTASWPKQYWVVRALWRL